MSPEPKLFIYMVVKLPLYLVRDSGRVVVVLGYLCKNSTHYMNLEKKIYCQDNQSFFFFPSLNKSIGIGTSSFLTINPCFSKL